MKLKGILNTVIQLVTLQRRGFRLISFTAGIIFLILIEPGDLKVIPSLCLWKKLFGFCPTCGTTRALSSFFHGNIVESISYNINIIVTAPLILFIYVRDIICTTKDWIR